MGFLWFLFCCAVLISVVPSFAILSLERERERERERASCFTLIAFKCHLTVSALCLLITTPWVCLQCVIVVFSSHTYFSI